MATENSILDVVSDCPKSPIKAAGLLLAFYITLHLAVGGVIHVLTAPDAVAAIAPGSSVAPLAAESNAPSPAGHCDTDRP